LAASSGGIIVSAMSLTLYYHPLSSYCHKVLIALYENDVEFERRVIDLGLAADRLELQSIWPICKFPVIRDHSRKRDVPESTIIIEYLDHLYGGIHPMIPTQREDALDARLWDRFCDNYLQTPTMRIVADRIAGARGDMDQERAVLARAYGVLEGRMTSRIWLSGKAFGLADCAAAPALFYANCVHAFPADLTHVPAYFERLTQRPSVARVLEESKPYFAMFPFAESLPPRYRA
jgi:glutathione S-transferase